MLNFSLIWYLRSYFNRLTKVPELRFKYTAYSYKQNQTKPTLIFFCHLLYTGNCAKLWLGLSLQKGNRDLSGRWKCSKTGLWWCLHNYKCIEYNFSIYHMTQYCNENFSMSILLPAEGPHLTEGYVITTWKYRLKRTKGTLR